jgi:hypothetical protein
MTINAVNSEEDNLTIQQYKKYFIYEVYYCKCRYNTYELNECPFYRDTHPSLCINIMY